MLLNDDELVNTNAISTIRYSDVSYGSKSVFTVKIYFINKYIEPYNYGRYESKESAISAIKDLMTKLNGGSNNGILVELGGSDGYV